MLDTFILLTPILVLAIVGLVGFVGCNPFAVFIEPNPPAPVLNGSAGDEKAFITWDAVAFDYDKFTLKRRIPPETSFMTIADLPRGTSAYTDTQLNNGTTYTYVIVGSGLEGDDHHSDDSSEFSVTPAPITFVQLAENIEALGNSAITTGAFASLSQGSLVIVWIWYQSSTAQVTGVTDTASNVYQRAVGPTHGGGALSAYQQEIWYASNVNGGAGIQVTAGFSAAFTAKKTISAHEYRGVSPVNPVGPAAAAIGNSATPSSGIATTSATSLVFGAAIVAGTATAGPGFTQRSTIDFNASEDQRAAAGPVSATFAATGAVDWIAQMVTFI